MNRFCLKMPPAGALLQQVTGQLSSCHGSLEQLQLFRLCRSNICVRAMESSRRDAKHSGVSGSARPGRLIDQVLYGEGTQLTCSPLAGLQTSVVFG